MRYSHLFIPTLKEAPSDAEAISHKLMVRAGYVRQLAAGLYIYLPLGQRVMQKINQIIREEMNAIGASELSLSALQLKSTWEKAGRWDSPDFRSILYYDQDADAYHIVFKGFEPIE